MKEKSEDGMSKTEYLVKPKKENSAGLADVETKDVTGLCRYWSCVGCRPVMEGCKRVWRGGAAFDVVVGNMFYLLQSPWQTTKVLMSTHSRTCMGVRVRGLFLLLLLLLVASFLCCVCFWRGDG